MKKLFGLVCAACLMLSIAACSVLSAPESYAVGSEPPIPSITQVVGNREFQGSSTTAQGGDGDLLSISCSYEKIPDVAKDISSYITTLTTTYGFTVSTPFDPGDVQKGAVLTKPASREGHTLTLTIEVPTADSYRIELKSDAS